MTPDQIERLMSIADLLADAVVFALVFWVGCYFDDRRDVPLFIRLGWLIMPIIVLGRSVMI